MVRMLRVVTVLLVVEVVLSLHLEVVPQEVAQIFSLRALTLYRLQQVWITEGVVVVAELEGQGVVRQEVEVVTALQLQLLKFWDMSESPIDECGLNAAIFRQRFTNYEFIDTMI